MKLTQLLRERFLEYSDIDFGLNVSELLLPGNYLQIHFQLDQLEAHTRVDWALVFLAVASNYLSDASILQYAVQSYNESSSNVVEELAFEAYEEPVDWFAVDTLIPKLIDSVTIEEWRDAYRRLFSVTVLWAYTHWDNLDEPSADLFAIWDDFWAIKEGRALNYHSTDIPREAHSDIDAYMKVRCEKFLEERHLV